MTENLYVHFPFCRRKCAYCALHSRAGTSPERRAEHVRRVRREIEEAADLRPRTVYFGGGTPALCDLAPLAGLFDGVEEFTVELHPLDVTDELLARLRELGVNRISLGVQSFDDSVLRSMGRLHSAAEAADAFARIRAAGFDNAGIDLIAGWPDDSRALDSVRRAIDLGIDHASVYSLIVEPGTTLARDVRRDSLRLPSDDAALDTLRAAANLLAASGLRRYEVSNYARPGRACRHNLAVWRGEDYLGLGPGAHSRVGNERWHVDDDWRRADLTTLALADDARERALFALRLAEGINLSRTASRFPALAERCARWRERLEALVPVGIVRRTSNDVYALTARGFEVCDAVMAELA